MKAGEPDTKSKPVFDSPSFSVYDSLLTLIYPQSCRICEKSVESQAHGFACEKCWRETKIFSDKDILCQKCGAFLRQGFSNFDTFCRRCNDDFYDKASAIGIYDKALLVSILNLKHEPYIPKILIQLLNRAFLNSAFQDATRMIPVPLSKKRLSERGFNQAFLLAKSLAQKTKISIDNKSLVRKTHIVKHRSGMDRKARHETVKNVFEVVAPRLITGERILLIDDVFASGATVSNCAKILKENGAEKVYVLTLARAFLMAFPEF